MKYTNWQELHKKAYSTQPRQGVRTARSEEARAFSKEELHRRAWARLQRLCSAQELDKLSHLAFLYDHGFRKNDTLFG